MNYNCGCVTMKNITYEELKQIIETKYKKFIKNNNWDMSDYINFSLQRQNISDIRERALINVVFKYDAICYTYICRYSVITSDFLEELVFITSPFFDISYYNDEYKELVCNILQVPNEERNQYISSLIKDSDKYSPIFISKLQAYKKLALTNRKDSKVDWFGIVNYQTIPRNVLEKYSNNFDTSLKNDFNRIITEKIKRGEYKFYE